jgi:hypothetical protein
MANSELNSISIRHPPRWRGIDYGYHKRPDGLTEKFSQVVYPFLISFRQMHPAEFLR